MNIVIISVRGKEELVRDFVARCAKAGHWAIGLIWLSSRETFIIGAPDMKWRDVVAPGDVFVIDRYAGGYTDADWERNIRLVVGQREVLFFGMSPKQKGKLRGFTGVLDLSSDAGFQCMTDELKNLRRTIPLPPPVIDFQFGIP